MRSEAFIIELIAFGLLGSRGMFFRQACSLETKGHSAARNEILAVCRFDKFL